jgi:hypothetical protein
LWCWGQRVKERYKQPCAVIFGSKGTGVVQLLRTVMLFWNAMKMYYYYYYYYYYYTQIGLQPISD